MNRLIVQAAIHPNNMGRVLLSVEREDGSGVDLNAGNVEVDCWATRASAPGDAPRYHPSVLFAIGNATGKYELLLDDLRYNEDDPDEQWHEALPVDVKGAVYSIAVHTAAPDAQGRCIVEQQP